MKDFNYWYNLYKNQQLEEFNTDRIGLLWLKIKSICRVGLIKKFISDYHCYYDFDIKHNLKREENFDKLFILLCENVESSHLYLNEFIMQNRDNEYLINEIELIGELKKLENFKWGGDYQNSLDKSLISSYIKIPTYRLFNGHQSFSYDILNSRFEQINTDVKNYVLASWYNHWSSILIEHIFKSHPDVLATVGQIKSVDFFIDSIPYDLKVTYLPAEYIKQKRKENGLPVELTYLKQKAKEFGIFFDKDANDSAIYHEIIEKMKDRNDNFCRSVLQTLKDEKLQILREAQNNPKILAQWLYENQGEMRFGSENRLFLVLVDSDDFSNSWKLKRNLDLLKPTITEYLDNFKNKNLNDLKISFEYKGKSRIYTAFADIIFVIK